jgi:hypothetical protein
VITICVVLWLLAGISVFMAKKRCLRRMDDAPKFLILLLMLVLWPLYPLIHLVVGDD